MTPEEKIEALREFLDGPGVIYSDDNRTAGYGDAMRHVRNIIDPPKPKWRELVDLTARSIFTDVDPLADVLSALSVLAAGDDVAVSLAHVVAICEAQVGDGWQADPDREPYASHSVDLLLNLLVTANRWQVTANAAAKWLRSLTDGGAA